MARGMKTTAKKTTAKKMMNSGKMSKPKKYQRGGSVKDTLPSIQKVVGDMIKEQKLVGVPKDTLPSIREVVGKMLKEEKSKSSPNKMMYGGKTTKMKKGM